MALKETMEINNAPNYSSKNLTIFGVVTFVVGFILLELTLKHYRGQKVANE